MRKISAFFGTLSILCSTMVFASQANLVECYLGTSNDGGVTSLMKMKDFDGCQVGQIKENVSQWTFGDHPRRGSVPAALKVSICNDKVTMAVNYKGHTQVENVVKNENGSFRIQFGQINTGKNFDLATFNCSAYKSE